jgi:hypothetical protein
LHAPELRIAAIVEIGYDVLELDRSWSRAPEPTTPGNRA